MPHAPVDPRRRCLKFASWPAPDRILWEEAVRQRDARTDPNHDDLDDDHVAIEWSPHTLAKAADGYGRWLGFLDWRGELDPDEAPVDRVTRKRAGAFFKLMRELENSPFTIVGRFNELRGALRVLAPGRDMHWLLNPGGRPLRSRMRMVRRPRQIHDCRVLYEWGKRLMIEALSLPGPQRRRVQFRDGLLIAILAARAMRLRSIFEVALGDQILRDDDGWQVLLGPEDIKNRKELAYGLPEDLHPFLERYVAVERQELLQGQQHDWFWVGWDGSRLDYRGVEKRVRWWSGKEFGKAFGPHHFRYCLGTTAEIVNPSAPGLGGAILGITREVYQESYNRAGQADAARRFHVQLQADRADTETLARLVFKETEARALQPPRREPEA